MTRDEREVRVVASQEVFYDWNAGAWTRNIAAFGASMTVAQPFIGQVSYLLQNHRNRVDTNTIVFAIIIRLKR